MSLPVKRSGRLKRVMNVFKINSHFNEEVRRKELTVVKDGPGPVMVSDTLCPVVHILVQVVGYPRIVGYLIG